MDIVVPGHGTGDTYEKILDAIIGQNTSDLTMIDLCCCHAPFTRNLDFSTKVFIDIIEGDRGVTSDLGEFYVTDVLGIHEAVTKRKYDICFALDAIEHFSKEDGYRLLERMNSISRRKVILFTPLGDLMVSQDYSNPDSHKSGWTPKDLPGYAKVICPEWHEKSYGKGAFFFWKTENIEQDSNRVKSELAFQKVI